MTTIITADIKFYHFGITLELSDHFNALPPFQLILSERDCCGSVESLFAEIFLLTEEIVKLFRMIFVFRKSDIYSFKITHIKFFHLNNKAEEVKCKM